MRPPADRIGLAHRPRSTGRPARTARVGQRCCAHSHQIERRPGEAAKSSSVGDCPLRLRLEAAARLGGTQRARPCGLLVELELFELQA